MNNHEQSRTITTNHEQPPANEHAFSDMIFCARKNHEQPHTTTNNHEQPQTIMENRSHVPDRASFRYVVASTRCCIHTLLHPHVVASLSCCIQVYRYHNRLLLVYSYHERLLFVAYRALWVAYRAPLVAYSALWESYLALLVVFWSLLGL